MSDLTENFLEDEHPHMGISGVAIDGRGMPLIILYELNWYHMLHFLNDPLD